jgi:hypothetical protein
MGTRAAALRGNTARNGCRSSSNDRDKAAMKGGGVSVGYGATVTMSGGSIPRNEGEDVFKR